MYAKFHDCKGLIQSVKQSIYDDYLIVLSYLGIHSNKRERRVYYSALQKVYLYTYFHYEISIFSVVHLELL